MGAIGRGTPEPGEVLLITGPAAAGKSTAARLVVERSVEPSVLVLGDSFAHALKVGRRRGWEEGAGPQNEVVVEATAEAAATYAGGGYFTVVDAMIRPEYLDVFIEPIVRRGVDLHYAVLLPPVDVVRSRAARRPPGERHDDAVLARISSYFSDLRGRDAHVVDAEGAPDETAQLLEARRREGTLQLHHGGRS